MNTIEEAMEQILTLAIIKHANDFAEYILGKTPEPSVSEAVAEAKSALTALFRKGEVEARIDELENYTYCGAEKYEIDERISALQASLKENL